MEGRVVVMADREAVLRVSDAEREQVVGRLGEQMSAGRLDLAEFEERMSAAYAARTRGELAVLVADLPQAEREREREREREPETGVAGRGAEVRWAVTGVVCLVIWAAVAVAAGEPGYFWPMWVIGPWGLVLLAGRCGWRRAGG